MTDFSSLSPDFIINSVEEVLGEPMSGFASSLPSYINRVYELETATKERVVAKFYRPGRWEKKAIEEEHRFVAQCAAEEIPVISPIQLPCGGSVGEYEGIYIAVYPKRWGREIELNDDEAWIRLGSLLGRMHLIGAQEDAPTRLALHPEDVTYEQLDFLLDSGHITSSFIKPFDDITTKILDLFYGEFDDIEFIRVHGDCHRANILERPGEGLMIIDFDDMLIAPPIQDLWLLLPDYAKNSQRELNLLLSGYEQFREFDYHTCCLIEPLRAMRMIYFLSWCVMQAEDNHFLTQYPDWGSDAFWRREIMDLEKQYSIIKSDMEFRKSLF